MEGLLPSFAACEKLDELFADNNQFSGSYFGSIFVDPDIHPVLFFCLILAILFFFCDLV